MSKTHFAKYRILAVLLALLTVVALLPSAVFATGETTHYIGVTSDVHGATGSLHTWLSNLTAPSLDRMLFGGDYPVRGRDEGIAHEIAAQCVSIVNDVCEGTPSILARGNHDSGGTYKADDPQSGTYDSGLVFNGDDYAVYVVKADEDNLYYQAFTDDELCNLNAALQTIEDTKPVFVLSHFPIHTFSGRTTANAEAMIEVLNAYRNVVFLWGHNHTMNDPYYGQVFSPGAELQYTSASADKAVISFAYACCGSMLDGNNGAYGMLAALTKTQTGATIHFSYKDLQGTTVSGGDVSIPFVSGSTVIRAAAVTGISTPMTGGVPDDSALAGAASYTAGPVTWDPAENPFKSDTAYTAQVTLTAASGYVFADGATATVNGSPASDILYNSDQTLTVAYTFLKTGAAGAYTYEKADEIKAGEVYVIAAQADGKTFAMTNEMRSTNYLKAEEITVSGTQITSEIDSSMYWTFRLEEDTNEQTYDVLNGESFLNRRSGSSGGVYLGTEDGAAYSDWLRSTSKDFLNLYVINSANQKMYLSVDEEEGAYYFKVSGTEQTLSLYRQVQTAAPVVDISEVEITVTQPVAGDVPDDSALVGAASYTAGPVTWDPADNPFKNDTAYTAHVTLTAASGYVFADGATATVNGEGAQCTVANGILTVTQHFNPTAAKKGNTYLLASEVVSGEQYVIVAQFGSFHFALTALETAVNGVCHLTGTPVTVSEDKVLAECVNDTMLWTFSKETAEDADERAFDVQSNGLYLTRTSSLSGLYAGAYEAAASYSDWMVDAEAKALYTYSENRSCSLYLNIAYSGSGFYFANSPLSFGNIRLYQLVEAQAQNDPQTPAVTVSHTGSETVDVEDNGVPQSGYLGYLDVLDDAWYADAVQFAAEKSLLFGISDRFFAPDLPVSRAMFATFLSRVAYIGEDSIPVYTSSFIDLTQDWYKKAVAWGAYNQIILGFSSSIFAPDRNVSREQAAVFLYRYAKFKGYDLSCDPEVLESFDDSDSICGYAKLPMAWAVGNGLIDSITNTTLAPKGHVTRAQLAAMAVELFDFIDA